MGVRQKAIELAIGDNEFAEALRLIKIAGDPISAYNIFGLRLLASSRRPAMRSKKR